MYTIHSIWLRAWWTYWGGARERERAWKKEVKQNIRKEGRGGRGEEGEAGLYLQWTHSCSLQGIIFFVTTSELSLYCLESCVYTVMSINSVLQYFVLSMSPLNQLIKFCTNLGTRRVEVPSGALWPALLYQETRDRLPDQQLQRLLQRSDALQPGVAAANRRRRHVQQRRRDPVWPLWRGNSWRWHGRRGNMYGDGRVLRSQHGWRWRWRVLRSGWHANVLHVFPEYLPKRRLSGENTIYIH